MKQHQIADEIGIDILQQKVGTIIMIETEDGHLFEIKVTVPEKGVVEVSGTEPRLKCPVLGVLTHSSTGDKKARAASGYKACRFDYWIGKLLKMSLIFKNGDYESAPVIHASIKGSGWQFEVF